MAPPTAFPGPQPPGPALGAPYGGGGGIGAPPPGPPGGGGGAHPPAQPLPGGRKGSGPNGEARYACEVGGARSVAQVGMDGLRVFDGSGQRCLHVYPLESIMKWSTPGATQLLCRVKTAGGSEVEVKLEARADTVQEMLDSLTAACMQVQEMLDHKAPGGGGARGGGGGGGDRAPLTHGRQGLGELGREIDAAEGQRKSWFGRSAAPASQTSGQVAVPSAVIFWHNPTHDGWLHSQGDHTKSWRRRWFVLKSGWLVRFIDEKVTMDTKARGAYDLSRCTSVSVPSPFDTAKQLAKPGSASLQLNMEGGVEVLLAADSEVERDLWREVLARAVKDLREGASPAGGGGARGGASGRSGVDSSSSGGNDLMRQLQQAEAGYSSHASHGGGAPPRAHRGGTITVVGYEGPGGYGSSNSPSAPTHGGYHAPPPPPQAASAANWQVCYTQDGQVYYHDPATGRVQWEAP